MSVTLTRNLKLKIDSNLTANSKYNLERLDLLGSTFIVDSTNTLNIRSQTDINIEPNSADLGGSGTDGTVTIGTNSHSIDSLTVYADEVNFSEQVGTLDQASGGTKYLRLRYKSDLNGSVDTSADRILSVDVDGSDRSLVLGGNLSFTGGNLTLTLSANSSLTLPTTGTLATLAGSETLTNKTIDASSNTLSNITNSSISASAGITYSKLNLSSSIVNSDVSNSAAIAYSKLNLASSITNSDINSSAAIARSKVAAGTADHVLINDSSGNLSSEAQLTITRGGTGASTANSALNNLLPSQAGNANKVLKTDGSNTSWESLAGSGTVTSVGLSMPSAIFDVADSPVTESGTITVTLDTQTANTLWAGPTTGAAAAPTFRALVAADIPTGIPAANIAGGTVDNTEFGYLNGVTSALQDQLDNKQPLDADLTALAALSTTGVVARTAANTYVPRTITAGTGISVSDGDGVAGNPTISSTITQYTDELAQDAVGTILTSTSSVTLTYTDATPEITADVIPGGVDHDQLLNFVTNEHIDHSTVNVNTASNSGLAGGGDITTSRSLSVDPSNAPTVTPASADIVLFADASNSNSLSGATLGSIITNVVGGSFAESWTTSTSHVSTHNLGTRDVMVYVYELDSPYQMIQVDTIEHTDTNTVTLTASQAPTGSGWRVLIKAII